MLCVTVSVRVHTSIHGRNVSGFEGGEGNSWSAHPMCSSWQCRICATHTSPVYCARSQCVQSGQALKSNATASYVRNAHKGLTK